MPGEDRFLRWLLVIDVVRSCVFLLRAGCCGVFKYKFSRPSKVAQEIVRFLTAFTGEQAFSYPRVQVNLSAIRERSVEVQN